MHYATRKDRKLSIACLGINPVIRFSQKTNASLLPTKAIKFISSIRQFIFNFSLNRTAGISISQMCTLTYIKGQVICGQ